MLGELPGKQLLILGLPPQRSTRIWSYWKLLSSSCLFLLGPSFNICLRNERGSEDCPLYNTRMGVVDESFLELVVTLGFVAY